MEVSNEQRERDKNRRGEKLSHFSNDTKDRSRDRKSNKNRIYVSNVPYEFKWKELKDLFRDQVGDVAYVQLFKDEFDKPRGCGIVEFNSSDSLKKALEVMHRFALDGRRLVIKEDCGNERDKYGKIIKCKDDKDQRDVRVIRNRMEPPLNPGHADVDRFNTFGLSAQFLDSINVSGPLFNRIFIANLDYKVDRVKLKEVFKMAGKIRNIDLSVDKQGNSRGFAIIEYDHPVEAVQAISMFDKQILYERTMAVRMDRVTGEKEIKLPEGLQGIGPGLGSNGEPLYDITRYIPQNITTRGQMAGIDANIMSDVPCSMNGSGNAVPINIQALGLGPLQSQFLQQNLISGDLGSNMARLQDQSFQNGYNGNGNMNAFDQPGMSLNFSAPSYGNRQCDSMPQNMFTDNSIRQKNTRDTILVENLPSSLTWQLLREKFSEAGLVDFASKSDDYTGMVRFKNPLSAETAIKMFHRRRIDGRTIDVQYY